MFSRMPIVGLCAAALFLQANFAHAEITVPANDGYVTNLAGETVMTTVQEEALEADLKAYKDATSNEIAVVILPELAGMPAFDVALQIGRSWGVGDEQKDNGIVFLVAYKEREVFLSIGRGLEGPVPDMIAKRIIETDIVPQFRDGKYAEGIAAGIDALKKHIGGEYTADRYAVSTSPDVIFFMLIFALIGLQWLAAFLSRSKSWWLGGVLGGAGGSWAALFSGWWLLVPLLVGVGLVFDYWVSKYPQIGRHRRGGGWRGGSGGWGSGGGGGGGFGGFGGGSFGGGGAGGRW